MSIDAAVIQSGLPGRPSRRTLITGAIWATPVVLGLAASPSVAASDNTLDSKAPVAGATLLLNYAQASPVWGQWVADGAHRFGGVTGSIELYVDQTAWDATERTVTSISLELKVRKSAFRADGGKITAADTGAWAITSSYESGDYVVMVLTWTGILQTRQGPRYTKVNFSLQPSTTAPYLQQLSAEERLVSWTAMSAQTTVLTGSYSF
ncbi:MAG: hypothetical protein KIT69_03970 [Propionibacteriaceae bacterium]|nr:hypothetical protein [Propionibacteriaceae bacterium]